jgi:hypothetical protein
VSLHHHNEWKSHEETIQELPLDLTTAQPVRRPLRTDELYKLDLKMKPNVHEGETTSERIRNKQNKQLQVNTDRAIEASKI